MNRTLEGEKVFRLGDFPYTDSFIRKYPPRKSDPQVSDIGVYYRAFQDINSLMRNQDFHAQKGPDSLPVQAAGFYKYAYLFAFKKLFRPSDLWLYGNLPPIGDQRLIERHKALFVQYALLSKPMLFSSSARKKILSACSLKEGQPAAEDAARTLSSIWDPYFCGAKAWPV